MTGHGVAGCVAAAMRIGTKLSLPDDFDGARPRVRAPRTLTRCVAPGLKVSTMIYFGIGGFAVCLSLLGYALMHRVPFARHYMVRAWARDACWLAGCVCRR